MIPNRKFLYLAISLSGWLAPLQPAPAAAPTAEQLDFFEKKIHPVLVDRCHECHSPEAKKIKGGLLLDTRASILQGGDHGPALVPGDPEKSLLIQPVRYQDEKLQMPPKHPLTPAQVADFEAWVKMGAPDPRARSATNPAPPPAMKNQRRPKKFIDQFIHAKLEAQPMTPVAATDKRVLIRRATFDLTGLPPTPEEVEAFLADGSSRAFAKVIDLLLASPR